VLGFTRHERGASARRHERGASGPSCTARARSFGTTPRSGGRVCIHTARARSFGTTPRARSFGPNCTARARSFGTTPRLGGRVCIHTARARSFGTTPRARSFGPYLYGTSTELRRDGPTDDGRQTRCVACARPRGGYVHRPVWTQGIYFDSHLMGLTYVRPMCPFMALVLGQCWAIVGPHVGLIEGNCWPVSWAMFGPCWPSCWVHSGPFLFWHIGPY
jgi:hypothetical protein